MRTARGNATPGAQNGPIPIFITNFNRADPIRKLVDWCVTLIGVGLVVIVDNGSTFAATMDFYDDARRKYGDAVRIIANKANRGRLVARDVAAFLGYGGRKVVFTDPDLVPYPDTPNDALLVLSDVLDKYRVLKAGMALEVDDVPDHFFMKPWVEWYERRHWETRTDCGRGWWAPVDTTFAMYRKAADFSKTTHPAIRLDRPYRVKHVDWYTDPATMTDEEKNYIATASKDSSGGTLLREYLKNPDEFRAFLQGCVDRHDSGALWDRYLRDA